MTLDLIRAWSPADLIESDCAICRQPFVAESVLAMSVYGEGTCPRCVEYLGRRNPEVFPSIEEFEEAKRRFPFPVWGSEEDLGDLDPIWSYTDAVSIIEREP